MLDGIPADRYLAMSEQEKRWLENTKKAVHDSDLATQHGTGPDKALEELFKGVDVAKNLRKSMLGAGASKQNQKAQYLEFIQLHFLEGTASNQEVVVERDGKPIVTRGPLFVSLYDRQNNKQVDRSFAQIVYDARCMAVHENENLNAAEEPDYHIQFDWSVGAGSRIEDGTIYFPGMEMWRRLRMLLAKFITGVDSAISIQTSGEFSISFDPPLGGVKPKRRG